MQINAASGLTTCVFPISQGQTVTSFDSSQKLPSLTRPGMLDKANSDSIIPVDFCFRAARGNACGVHIEPSSEGVGGLHHSSSTARRHTNFVGLRCEAQRSRDSGFKTFALCNLAQIYRSGSSSSRERMRHQRKRRMRLLCSSSRFRARLRRTRGNVAETGSSS